VHGYEQDCPESFSVPIDAAPRPTSYYACCKLFGEAVARYHFEHDGLESICLRIGTLLESDLPPDEGRVTRNWLSHRDLVQITRRSIQSGTAFGIYYAVSGNTGRFHVKWSTKSGHRVKTVTCHNEVMYGNRDEKAAELHGRFQAGCGGTGDRTGLQAF